MGRVLKRGTDDHAEPALLATPERAGHSETQILGGSHRQRLTDLELPQSPPTWE